jgi:hypothetical protein
MTTRGAADLVRIRCRFPLWAFWRDAEGLTAARGSAILRGASLGELEERLTAYENPRSLPGALAREFPDWQIDVHPGGLDICTAYWCSPDGRSRRVVVAKSGGDLLWRLRAIKAVQP